MVALMPVFLAPVVALLMSQFLMQMGASLANTLIPLRGYVEDFPPTLIGALGTAYFGGFVIGCVLVPYIVRRVGHIRTFAALAAASSVSVMVLPLFPDPVVWLILRVLSGAAAAGLFAVIESWLNDKTDSRHRGATFSVYQLVAFCASVGSQNLLGIADVSAPDLFMYGTALIVLALIPVSMTRADAPRPPVRVTLDMRWAASVSPIAVYCVVCVGVANGSSWSLAPVFMSSQGYTAQEVGWYIMTFMLGGAAGQFPVGRISDRLDRRWVILGVAAVSGVLGLLLSLEYGGSQVVLMVSVFGLGFSSLTLYSLCIAHINDLGDPERRVELASAMLLFYGIGASTGPLFTSFLVGITSYESLYRVTAAAHGSVALFAIWRMLIRPGRLSGDRPSFVVTLPRTVPFVSELDPATSGSDTADEHVQHAAHGESREASRRHNG